MRNIRSLFFGCLTIFALGMLIYQTWLSALLSPAAPVPTEQGPDTAAHTDVPPSEPAPLAADKAATPVDSIPGDPLVLMQSKLFVGADLWTKNLYKMRGDQPTASDTQAMTMF
ncbi:MAG: hypothetical protein IT290_12875, partial [Deltaproteobacteria bacterium]|nr:hypothetical protein [Deltaproteobacteria bacterium]